MYRSWFEGVYQRKNLVRGRIEFIDGDGACVGLSKYEIGDDLILHVRDGLTSQTFQFPITVCGVRFSNEVWYDVVVWHSPESAIGTRVNRVRGENLSTNYIPPSEEDKDLDGKVVTKRLMELVTSKEVVLESLLDAPAQMPESPVSYFDKQLYVGRPATTSTHLNRLFLTGTLNGVDNHFQLGDYVYIFDGGEAPDVLTAGYINEIHVEDEFYYSVAVPTMWGKDRYVVVHQLTVDLLQKVETNNGQDTLGKRAVD